MSNRKAQPNYRELANEDYAYERGETRVKRKRDKPNRCVESGLRGKEARPVHPDLMTA